MFKGVISGRKRKKGRGEKEGKELLNLSCQMRKRKTKKELEGRIDKWCRKCKMVEKERVESVRGLVRRKGCVSVNKGRGEGRDRQ